MAVTLVEKYNPEWPKWFEEIKAFLGEKVTQTCIRIEHVGSTSVRKMTAKPIIDLILVIEPRDFEKIKELLGERGYYHQGDLGIKNREAFDLKDVPVKGSMPRHHLYVCPKHSAELKKEIAFRDFLRHRGGENMACMTCMRTVMAVIVPQFIWLDGLKNMFQPHEMSYGPRGPRPHAGSPVASLYSHILQIPQEG